MKWALPFFFVRGIHTILMEPPSTEVAPCPTVFVTFLEWWTIANRTHIFHYLFSGLSYASSGWSTVLNGGYSSFLGTRLCYISNLDIKYWYVLDVRYLTLALLQNQLLFMTGLLGTKPTVIKCAFSCIKD